MGKIKINKGGNYTVISNHVLQNTNLSLKAKGLYAFMWSLPDTWDYSVSGLTKVLKEGRDAINEALKELEREGYLVRSILRKGGKFTDMDYTLNEFPDPFMEKHESQKEKSKEKPEPKKKKKSYAQIFEDPKNETIKQSLVKYVGALRGMNYTPQVATVYGANDGFKTYALYKFQAQYLREDHPREDFRKMYYVFREVEMPLIPLCTDMEMRGVEIREDFAKELSEDFNKEMVEVEAKCDAYVEQFKQYILDHNNLMRLTKGTCKINYSSPQQVAALFYDIFKLRSVSRKEPRGTGDKIIQKFLSTAKKKDTKKSREFAEFLENYQRFKEIKKLLGTYVDKIPQVKEPKINAVYTTYNQYGAKTGRFSSSDTVSKINLQNIPSKEKRIRKIFKARDGYKLVGGDFSQIEPRVLAFLSGDESMINAYKEGKDLYAIMGSQVYQLPYEDCREFYPDGTVNAEGKHRRTTMKSVLLGIMYERGATAIGEQFNKSAEWAQQLIDNFYKSFPKINQYRLKIENMAETYGYVTTITGRKRRLPDMQLEDKDDYRYQEAHRQSLNSVIQGSSADIMKLSMIAIYNDPRYKALDCHMIITVHDELIMEVPEDHIKEGAELLVGTMKRVGHSLIDLPMSVDAEVNDYWYGENLAEKYGV